MLYPLKFAPRFVEKMWGGRKLQTILGKPLPAGKQIGESWELYDFPPGVVDQSDDWVSSPIVNGPHAGKTLHWAMQKFERELLGNAAPAGPHRQFPLLVKFLDAREDLSLQVHPDQSYADANPGAHLKTEAWYVLHHDPGARLFKGLKPASKREHLEQAIKSGSVEQHLLTIDANVHDCHYLPSGTIHALGAGMLVAEVQTPSDTTFRVFDFNRVDPSTGKTRMLHVEQALQCIDFDRRENSTPAGPHSANADGIALVESPYFRMEKQSTAVGESRAFAEGTARVLIVLEGTIDITAKGVSESVQCSRGETVLLPAAIQCNVRSRGGPCLWITVSLPAARAGNTQETAHNG